MTALFANWLAQTTASSLAVALLAAALLALGAELLEQAEGPERMAAGRRVASALLIGIALWAPWLAGMPAGALALIGCLPALLAAALLIGAFRPADTSSAAMRALFGLAGAALLIALAALPPLAAGIGWGQVLPVVLPIALAGVAQSIPLAGLLLLHRPDSAAMEPAIWAVRGALGLATALVPGLALAAMALHGDATLLLLPPLALVLASLLAVAALLGHAPQRRAAPAAPRDDPVDRLVDPLTRLPTRIGIEQQLAIAVADCDRHGGSLAVLVIDLDGFNPVNTSFGHDSGDALLREVSKRLAAGLGGGDVVGRIGADDFVVLLKSAQGGDAVADFATRALDAIALPYMLAEREVVISASIGIATYPEHGGLSRLLGCADTAKNAAKRLGGACYCLFSSGMSEDAREQLDMLRDLRRAIERHELELFFQPKIDADSGQVTAAEALLRWRHPVRGLVLPGVFIPIAERFGYMRELGNWVIEAACRQAHSWRESGLRMRVAINLSAQQMRQRDIVDRIESALTEHQIHPSLLTCEITESVAMEDTQATQDTFRALGQLGVHLSIDDFGTGYSSLSYLRQLPAAELKIDRAFVTDVDHSPDAQAIVDAVLKLAHALGLRVVAEGVENQQQQAVLAALGCDEFQGFLFARPMSAQALLLWAMDDNKVNEPQFRASLFGDTGSADFLPTAPQ